MRRIYGVLMFSILWFVLPSDFSLSQPPEKLSAAQTISLNGEMEPVAENEWVDDLGMNPDGSGIYLDFFEDKWANKHTTQRIDDIGKGGGTSKPTQTTLSVEGAEHSAETGWPLELSKLEESDEDITDPFGPEEAVEPVETISDPLEPVNRAFFLFNDKLYFWLLKPVSIGYGTIVPKPLRIGVRNFFYNLGFPIRFVNCLLQAKFEGAGLEALRFVFNSTVGLAGFLDLAKENLDVKRQEEDLGQTLGVYGMGPAFYINWPILGPSSLRDTVGLVGDGFLNPVNYLDDYEAVLAVRAGETVNGTSLKIGDYEDLKRAALDPYIAVRDAYYQYRKKKIKE